ncbi:MAG: prepilin-type N-terminal cleavage/methylation domain-containing protein [Planctomycetes bacterium]|nr:prepilin-type N-terminal cleavage/methylation domain-containing protein [Planctomycetota bacterium]
MMTKPINTRANAEMNGRRGYTLIEMVAVLSVGTVVMGVAVGLMLMLLRVERDSRMEVAERGAVNRLADQFRRDVRAADRLTPTESPEGEDAPFAWQLSVEAGRVVEYRAEPGALVRAERADEKVLGRESYRLPALATVSIDLVGEKAPGIVRLRITPGGDRPPSSIGQGLAIDAALARDRRFVKQNQP